MASKIGRNDPCTCGSNKKYKNCCGQGKGGKSSFRLNQILAGLVFGAVLVAAGLAYIDLDADDPVVEEAITLRSAPSKSKVPPPPFEIESKPVKADETKKRNPNIKRGPLVPKPMDSLPADMRRRLQRDGIYLPDTNTGQGPVDTSRTGSGQ